MKKPNLIHRILALSPIPIVGDICAKKVFQYAELEILEQEKQRCFEFMDKEKRQEALKLANADTFAWRALVYEVCGVCAFAKYIL